MNPKKWLKKRLRGLQLAWLGRYGEMRNPRQWVFVLGCYNSGTTLLHDVLANHPDIARLPREGQYCTDQLLVPGDVGLARSWALAPERFTLDEGSDSGPDPLRIKRQWSTLMSPASNPVFLEKSIPNAGRIRWLNSHFENAYFIAIIRNGFAVSEGIRRKAGLPVKQAARQWATANRIMLEDLGTVERSLVITYEEFTRDPGETLARIFAFLDLPAHQESADGRQWKIHGVVSSIRDMNQRSIDRLQQQDRDVIRQEAGALLRQFGYLADS